jgi:putative chitinase
VNKPAFATRPEHQPAILASFWDWKQLARFADASDFLGCVKTWNGGTNGLADRRAALRAQAPVIARLRERAGDKDAAAAGAPSPPKSEPAGTPARAGRFASLLATLSSMIRRN